MPSDKKDDSSNDKKPARSGGAADPRVVGTVAILIVLTGGGVFTWLLNAGKLTPESYVAALALITAAALYLVGPPGWAAE
jgi:hypothetical protein